MVELRGKTNHLGRDATTLDYIDYRATLPGVSVWISEHPYTRDLDILTDDTGGWTMYVINYEGVDLELSFVYEKDGVNYPTVRFSLDAADVEYGVEPYIASPPDSVEGDNDSGPGQP